MLLVLIAPFLKRLATPLGLALLFVLYGVFNPYPFECRFGWYTFFSMNMVSFCGMAWFVLGTWLRRSGVVERIASMCGKKNVLLCLTCGGVLLFVRAICVLRGWHWAMSCYPGWISIPLVMVGIWAVMPSVRLPQGVLACTFPLYLMHGYAILLLTLTMGSVYGESVYVGAALTLAVSFVLVGITRLAGERVCRVAFGGR